MSPRRAAATRAIPVDNTDNAEQGRLTDPPIPKVKKPTVAQNAQAIANLAEKMTGVDTQLATMNQLLAQIATGGGNSQNNNVLNTTQSVLNSAPPGPIAQHDVAAGQLAGTRFGPNAAYNQPATYLAGPYDPPAAVPPAAQAVTSQHPAYSFQQPPTYQTTAPALLEPYSSSTRARHHTAGHPPTPPPSWPGAGGAQVRAPTMVGQHRLDYLTAQQQPVHPWDHPPTLQDMENDAALTRRVTEALHTSAAPFNAHTGKHAQFPHHLVTRGPKKLKTNLGELTLAEYSWGFLQLIKMKDQSDDSVPFMNMHLERICEDATLYTWEGIRQLSEDICSKIALGTLRWSDTYVIHRLQAQTSQKTPLGNDQKLTSQGRSDPHDMPDEVKRGKPGPPCKFYQTGACTHASDHVQNGYRQLHICAYCLTNKCQFQPHTSKDCKTKKFNSQKKSQSEAGFGN